MEATLLSNNAVDIDTDGPRVGCGSKVEVCNSESQVLVDKFGNEAGRRYAVMSVCERT